MSPRFAAAILTAILAVLPVSSAALDLQLDDVVTETGKFDFTRKLTEAVEAPIHISRDALIGSSPSYDVWMERDGVSEVPQFDYFRYEVYVRPKASPGQVTLIPFQGKPTGAFDDQFVKVHFRISDGPMQEEGTIVLPIFGYVAPDALGSHQPDEPTTVYLNTDEEISVPLTNESKRMPVTITRASASPRDPTLWKPLEIRGAMSGAFTPFLLRKGATNSVNLRIFLRPRTAQAFATALIRGKGKEDDVITVSVNYKTLARDERSFPIPVRVRFEPWPPYLPLIAVAGAVLGWLVLLVVKAKREDWKDRLRILGAAVAAALLVEALGMLLVANGRSELKILDFKMDPFQMLPAALIGMIAGLAGYQSRNLLRKIGRSSFFRFGNTGTGNAAV